MSKNQPKQVALEMKMSAAVDGLKEEQKCFIRSLLETAFIKAHPNNFSVDKAQFMSEGYDRLKEQMKNTMEMDQAQKTILENQPERFNLRNKETLPMQVWINENIDKIYLAIMNDSSKKYEDFVLMIFDKSLSRLKDEANDISELKVINALSTEIFEFSRLLEQFQVRLASASSVLENRSLNADVPSYENRLKNQYQSMTHQYAEKLNDILATKMGETEQTLRDVVLSMDSYRNKADYLLPHVGGVQ